MDHLGEARGGMPKRYVPPDQRCEQRARTCPHSTDEHVWVGIDAFDARRYLMDTTRFDRRPAPGIAALLLLAAAMLASSLGGCGGGGDDQAGAGVSAEDSPVEACLVKPTPPGEQPQPLPPSCAVSKP
jgi:hypothetical protein